MAEQSREVQPDPRHLLAQRRMQAAHEELSAKEAASSTSKRKRHSTHEGELALAELMPSISGSTIVHCILLMIVIVLCDLSVLGCVILLSVVPIAAWATCLAAGVLNAVGLSYASAYYLGVIESTSNGHTTPDQALREDWRTWFWTLPASLGMLALAAIVGYGISRPFPEATLEIIGVTVWLLYPLLQLSSLETGSPLSPVSLPVLRTLVTRPAAWIVFYALSFLFLLLGYGLIQLTWRDPPILTVLLGGPLEAVGLLGYGWMLGQLGRWLTLVRR